MEVRNFTIQEMKQLLSDFSINKDNIFIVNRKKIKLSREFMEDFHKSSYFIKSHYGIDREQIEWLDSLKNKTPNNKLPDGVISYFGVDVGIIYPSYYLGLIPFEHNLSREELSLILKNFRTAVANNEELLRAGVFNEEFVLKHMLYLKDTVGLIGLDGEHVKREEDSSFEKVYEHFDDELSKVLVSYIKHHYDKRIREDYSLETELNDVIKEERNKDIIDYPSLLMDDIEKSGVLTRVLK